MKSFKYLGVQLSYYNFERETMALRLRHSEQTSHQLHRWLYTQRMDVQHRTQLWFQCTFSCLRYGIIATGFTEATLLMFYRFCIRQLRRIFRAPVRITRETNSQFLSKHHIVDPLLRLRDICLQTASRALSRHQTLQQMMYSDSHHCRSMTTCFRSLKRYINRSWRQIRLTRCPTL